MRASRPALRRFSDFQAHLGISRAVLTDRLTGLVDDGLLERVPVGGREEYVLTDAGLALWPALFALTQWGEATTSPTEPRRIFAHTACGADLEPSGRCPACHEVPGPAELDSRPGPGPDRRARQRVSPARRWPADVRCWCRCATDRVCSAARVGDPPRATDRGTQGFNGAGGTGVTRS